MKNRVPVCARLLFMFSAQNAFGADLAIATSTSDKTEYKAADFAQFAPRTTLDIVRRIPGFSINSGDSGSRRFGQASGNVLINGQRVSGKSNDAESVLGRISTANVNRIEVLDGTALGIPGMSGQVVNVTTRDAGGVSGTWKWKVRSRENLRPTWNDFGATVSGQRGTLSWALEAASAPERGASAGPERVTDGAGNVIETRKEDFTHDAEAASIAGSLAWNPAGGSVANLSAKFAAYQPDDKEVSKFFQAGGVVGRRLFQGSEDETNSEIGADYEFGFGPGRLKTIALVRREDSPTVDHVLRGNLDGSDISESIFAQTVEEDEYILRSEYATVQSVERDWRCLMPICAWKSSAESSLSHTGGYSHPTSICRFR